MAISNKHKYVSGKADGGDTSLVRPSNWNDEHDLTMATGRILGRTTAGTGTVEELTAGTGLTLSAGSLSVTSGTYAAAGDIIGQQTIWVPAAAMTPRTTNGAASGSTELATNDVMVKYLAFDAATSEGAQFGIQMPKGWDEGTLVCQFVWTHPATATNFGVVWGIRAVAFTDDDALDTAFGSAVEVTDTGGTTSDVYISDETSALTVAGSPGAEEYVVFEVYRDPPEAGDTMAVDAYLIGVKIHYTTNAAKDD